MPTEASAFADACAALRAAALRSADLVRPSHRARNSPPKGLGGLCYVLSEVLAHAFPGRFAPIFVRWAKGGTHWLLKDRRTGELIDIVAGKPPAPWQVETIRPMPFMTKAPSRRCRVLAERAGLAFPA